ncbi:MAG: outer membrane protein assembly factor BamA [Thermoanaerobaculia bacterium]|nr:outer membrane protein assembly factor BamA [Thermoanaerobaculia bacterium]
MRQVQRWLPVALFLLAAGARAETIRGVEFRGLHLLAEETVRYYLGLVDGQELDEAALNRSIEDLWRRNLVDDLKIERLAADGGVRLIVTVAERPILRSLDFKGLKRLSRTDITERITKESISVREGSPISLGEVKRLQTTIEEMYREKGFRFAKAEFLLEEVAPTERRVVFSIDEAEKVRIGDIKFADNTIYGDWRLKWAMSKTKETNLLWRVLKRDIYNPATIAEDMVKVKDLYRGAGYKNVLLEDPVLGVKEKKSGKRSLKIEIPVVEGRRFKLGEIKIEGNQVFNEAFLAAQFSRPRGGWLRSSMVTKGTEAVQDAYKNYGHIFANIDLQLVERENDIADIDIKITEGDQYRVGRMEFEGNTRTRDKVLRREFRIQEGTLLNMGAIKGSLFKVNQLGYFKLNETDPITFENFDTEKKTVDVKVKGDESDRTELQVGAGWSETYGFFGQLSVRTQNFLGRGETVGLSFQSGRYQDEYGLSYYIPWWLDRPQSIGLQLFKSNLNYSQTTIQQSERQSQGAVLTYGRNFGLFGSGSISYTLSQSKDRLFYSGPANAIVELNYDIANSSIQPTYSFDSRDSRLETTRGWNLVGSVEYAGGFLGGDNYFWRPEVHLSRFQPLTFSPVKTLAAFNLEAGIVKPFDGREVVPLERYFMGGENSVRGFQFRSIFVRDEKTNLPVLQDGYYKGGNKFLQMNVELQVLVGGPFRVILFADGGNVYDDDQSIDVSRLRYSAGGELRIFVPIFGAPLRFIYSSNLDPIKPNPPLEPGDRFESFQFSIGATF